MHFYFLIIELEKLKCQIQSTRKSYIRYQIQISLFGHLSLNLKTMGDSNQFFPILQDQVSYSFNYPEWSQQKDSQQGKENQNLSQLQQSQSLKSQKNRKSKRKIIQKQKKTKREQKIQISNYENIQKGRRRNTQVQKNHLLQNQSFNDIVYHYCRFIYFLTYLTKSNKQKSIIKQPNQQSKWMSNIQQIMQTDNYPLFSQEKPEFLLHSNTPHFLFQHMLKTENKHIYTSTQMKDIILFTLFKRDFSSQVINSYILPYWDDIVALVNNNQQKNQQILQNQTPRKQTDDFQTQCKSRKSKTGSVSPKFDSSKAEKQRTERESLNQQIQADQSIIAYEIACYLHSCCEKYSIKITQ